MLLLEISPIPDRERPLPDWLYIPEILSRFLTLADYDDLKIMTIHTIYYSAASMRIFHYREFWTDTAPRLCIYSFYMDQLLTIQTSLKI